MPENDFERTLDAITVGIRHRKDFGDIDELADSIRSVGMLHPITITPDGVLVCGLRRLEAVRRLGWRTIKVWVRSGISDRLTELLAQRDENELHKDLTEIEQAELYAELKALHQEDAERRQEATRFGGAAVTGDAISGEVSGDAHRASPPLPRSATTSRHLASQAITGADSYNRHERVLFIRAIAGDRLQPTTVRELAATELASVEAGGRVEPSYRRVRAAIELAARPAENDDGADQFAAEVTERVKQRQARRGLRPADPNDVGETRPRYRTLRSFLLTWTELEGWTKRYDLEQLANDLSDEEYARFDRVTAETVAFRDQLAVTRSMLHSGDHMVARPAIGQRASQSDGDDMSSADALGEH